MEARSRANPAWDDPLKLIATWLGWWFALALIWLLLVDTLAIDELAVGVVAAAIAATVAAAVHRRGYIRFWPRLAWLRGVPYMLWDATLDCGLLAGALWRRVIGRQPVRGVTIRVPFHHGGDNGRDGARRALVNFAVSFTPNTYVVDIDPEGDSLLVHQLVGVRLDRVLRREQQRAANKLPNRPEGEDL